MMTRFENKRKRKTQRERERDGFVELTHACTKIGQEDKLSASSVM
jgi:hypothetical protein